MHIVIGIIVAAFTIALAVGAITGRVRATSCCSVTPADRDARLMAPPESSDVLN